MKFVPGCACCCAAATINVSGYCGNIFSGPSMSSTFELLDAAGVTVLDTKTGTSVSFTGIDGSLSYKVRQSKAGYHTTTSGTIAPGCGGTVTTSMATWPSPYSLTVHVQLYDGYDGFNCPLSGATVTVSGDGSGSGTTDASGNVSISLTSTTTNAFQSLSIAITPPAGHGAASKTVSASVNACSPSTQTITLIPDASHCDVVCNTRYMPNTLTWTDDYGSGTATYFAGTWEGSYTYTSNHCVNTFSCISDPPYPNVDLYAEQTGSVTVLFGVFPSPPGAPSRSCSTSYFSVWRAVWVKDKATCPTSTLKCQPIDDAFANNTYASRVGYASTSNPYATISCGTSVSMSIAISAYVNLLSCGTWEETAVNVTVTGTI